MILVHQAIPSVWEAHFQEARLAGQKGQNINESVRGEEVLFRFWAAEGAVVS